MSGLSSLDRRLEAGLLSRLHAPHRFKDRMAAPSSEFALLHCDDRNAIM
jgi:hypothetical protein